MLYLRYCLYLLTLLVVCIGTSSLLLCSRHALRRRGALIAVAERDEDRHSCGSQCRVRANQLASLT